MCMNLSYSMKLGLFGWTEHRPVKAKDRIVENWEDRNRFGRQLWKTGPSKPKRPNTGYLGFNPWPPPQPHVDSSPTHNQKISAYVRSMILGIIIITYYIYISLLLVAMCHYSYFEQSRSKTKSLRKKGKPHDCRDWHVASWLEYMTHISI